MNRALVRDLLREALGSDGVLENYPTSALVSFRTGASAAFYVCPKNVRELSAVIGALSESGTERVIMGNGSNMLFTGDTYEGVIVQIARTGELAEVAFDGCEACAGAGASLSAFARECSQRGLGGLEFASGIPASVGGGVIMNAGAYGGELKSAIVSVTSLRPDGEIVTRSGGECGFGYRESIFRENGEVILSARFALQPADREASLARVAELTELRRSKQPLSYPSAGSFFKRPEGYFAGKLIDEAGLKGLQIGGAAVSELHAGFIINKDGATAEDIVDLSLVIKETIFEKFRVTLENEVLII